MQRRPFSIYAHHPTITDMCSRFTVVPFLLWHSTGFTIEFMDFLQNNAAFGVTMLDCERKLLNNWYVTFSKIQKKYHIGSYHGASQRFPDFDSIQIWKDCPTRHSITGCFLHSFWENIETYVAEMRLGTMSENKLWLSCDHTFSLVANFGVIREIDGQWADQYTGLFCVLNGDGGSTNVEINKRTLF